ncbi:MULE transposase domain containing protein [Nitzschia inconspicua]|uniref:MULE transposase domain containing protein n=1 Tax=Nitzschia inconspicua TaxID=303405 RepID=A0A9K3M6K7_9STRA|nr:MULE transposase domain containing protein [Nitzschia inconspicua]
MFPTQGNFFPLPSYVPFPLLSEKTCHDDVFLWLLEDLHDNDIHIVPDNPDKSLHPELDNVPPDPQLRADSQPEPTRHRDNYFTSLFIEVPKEFEDMSKVDLAILDEYEESSRGQTWQRKGYSANYLETGIVQSCGPPIPPKTNGRAPKKIVNDKLEDNVDYVIEVNDGKPVSKDVMKATANAQRVRASYNQSYHAINRPVTKVQREKHQAPYRLIMSYLHHFQLRNEDSAVKAESDADKCLQRLRVGICPGIMTHSLLHVRPVLSLDGIHLKSQWRRTLYIPSVQTACDDIYPVSLAIIKDSENADGWKWFLELLVQAVPLLKMQHPNNRCKFCYFTFISDRQKGLIQALQQLFPDNQHCFCSIHIVRNVEKAVGKQVAKHVYALSATFSKRESDKLLTN